MPRSTDTTIKALGELRGGCEQDHATVRESVTAAMTSITNLIGRSHVRRQRLREIGQGDPSIRGKVPRAASRQKATADLATAALDALEKLTLHLHNVDCDNEEIEAHARAEVTEPAPVVRERTPV